MKKIQILPETTVEIMNNFQNLRQLAEQISLVGHQIIKLTDKLGNFNNAPGTTNTRPSENKVPLFLTSSEKTRPLPEPKKHSEFEAAARPSNIIPFPGPSRFPVRNSNINFNISRNEKSFVPLLARPGMSLPPNIEDFRPLLQRDGLILLAWDMRITEKGNRYTAYWVTSTGVFRYYASKPHSFEDFYSARPHHKSYAAEDGIEFYGQKPPVYLVHAAPDLMMSNPRHKDLRTDYIKTLKSQGINVDFNYEYLLKAEKNRNMRAKRYKNEQHNRAGA